jgi:periplasmic protein TonB
MKNSTQPTTLLEMLFENKNKAYGAYALRKAYSSTLTKATFIGVSLVLGSVLSSFVFIQNTTKTIVHETCKGGIIIDLDKIKEQLNLPKEKQKTEQPRKSVQLEEVAFTENIQAGTNDVIDAIIPEFKAMEDVIISTQNVKGIKIPDFVGDPNGMTNGTSILPPVIPLPEKEVPEILDFAELQPSFAGGQSEMYKFLSENLKYPRAAQNMGTQGIVFVAFVVEKDGSITDVKVIKGIGFGCNEESERVIKKMPKWNAGMQNGKPVRVRFTIPIKFKMN